jgi:predicted permease
MMSRLRSEIAYRLRSIFSRSTVEQEMENEFAFHIERETAKLVREGLSPAEADRRARAAFGGVQRIKDDTRDAHGVSLFEQGAQDLRYAVRALVARKTFALGVIITLALGVGANATMFGIVDRLLFRAPPRLTDPSTVHRIYLHSVEQGEPRVDRNFAFPQYLDLKRTVNSFSDLAAFQTTRFAVGDGEAVHEVPVTVASASYFDFFSAQEDTLEGSLVAVLGYGFWQSQYGGRNVIGEQIRVGSKLRTIIGVAPSGFVGMSDQGVPAMFVPITSYASVAGGKNYATNYFWSWLEMIARRKPGVSADAAQADLTHGFVDSWRNMYETGSAQVKKAIGTPVARNISGELTAVQFNRGPQASRDAQVAKWIGGVAIIVLLIACANVANLLLSRAIGRRREIAVRLALGVSRARLVRQLMTEALLLAVLGSAAGLAIAQWGAASIRKWFLPADLDVGVFTDVRTLMFALVVTIVVALITGVVPAVRASREDVAASLKAGARSGSQHHTRMRTTLLVSQVALSAILLVGAGLFVRSLRNVYGYRLGYDTDKVVFATMRARGVPLTPDLQRSITERMLAAAQSVPGISHVSKVQSVPFFANDVRGLLAPGVDSVNSRGRFILQIGSSDYFATMGTRIVRGRAFTDSDRPGTPPVVVVSEGMARAIWGAKDAIGQCLAFQPDSAGQPIRCMTVIGIAEEMHLRSFADAREFSYYVPALQSAEPPEPKLLARASGDVSAIIEPLRRRLQAEMPGAAYVSVFPMTQLVDFNFKSWRLGSTMFVAFGGLALILSAVGLYSLIAYEVAQRRRELSVRVALGATMSHVVGFVVGRGVRLVALGLVVGGAIALWGAPRLQSQLWQQEPRDPMVFSVVVLSLLAVGALATAGPAFRASRVDPNAALRED